MKVVIAEDEDIALKRLQRILEKREDVAVVASCCSGDETVDAVINEKADILVCDIDLPVMNGVDAAVKLQRNEVAFVFVTAHPEFALDGYDVEAADFVLKPFTSERLNRAIDVAARRVLARRALRETSRIRDILGADPGSSRPPAAAPENSTRRADSRVIVRDNGRVYLLRSDEISRVEAHGSMCKVYAAGKVFETDGPFHRFLSSLGPGPFVQLGRSVIVNVNFIRELQEMFKGALVAVLSDGTRLRISRRNRQHVLDHLVTK